MRNAMLRLAVATAAATASVALGMPAMAAPSTTATPTGHAVLDGGRRGGDHHGFRFGGRRHRFPIVTPFLFGGGFHSFDSFGFGGGGGCDIFLAVGDINSYVLCRVG